MKIKKIAVALGAAFSIMAFAANPANVSASERTKIVFWHEMTGPAQVELKRLVNEFNKHQDKYEVEAEFEGDYNEAVQKILNTHGTDASPAVFQAMDISSAQMYYSKHTTPVQKFIDEDGYDASHQWRVPFTQRTASSFRCRSTLRSPCSTITRRCLKSSASRRLRLIRHILTSRALQTQSIRSQIIRSRA